jgi:enterochelin esterase-like enzyme
MYAQDYERYKKILDTTISSQYLGFDKHISITVPFEWQQDLNRDFPLIIVFDRQNQRSHNYILRTIDYLTSNEQMPSAVIISIASEEQYRYLETLHKASNTKGLAEENEDFIFKELIPLAEKQFLASKYRLFIGHSRYGYFTTSLLHSRAEDLNAVISLSPFFKQKNVDLTDSIATINNKSYASTKYYRFGIGNDYPSDFLKMDSVVKQLNNTKFKAKGFLFKEADHNVTPGLSIGISLYEVFKDWSAYQAKYFSNEQKDLSIINTLKKDINDSYGVPLAFSLGTLNGKGWYFYSEKSYDKAIEAWKLLLDAYPNFTDAYLFIIDAQKQLKQDYSATVTAFYNSLDASEIYSAEEKQALVEELKELIK